MAERKHPPRLVLGPHDWPGNRVAPDRFSLGVIAVACTQLADDLPAPPAEPDLWLDGDDWIDAA